MNILSLFEIHFIHSYSHNYDISPLWLKYDYWTLTIQKITFFFQFTNSKLTCTCLSLVMLYNLFGEWFPGVLIWIHESGHENFLNIENFRDIFIRITKLVDLRFTFDLVFILIVLWFTADEKTNVSKWCQIYLF